MSRSSFGQPPVPQVGVAPKPMVQGPMSSPKMAPQAMPAGTVQGPMPDMVQRMQQMRAGGEMPMHPSMFRRGPQY